MQDFYRLLAVSPRGTPRLNFRVYEITSRGDRRRFARFPWQIYRRDARWVPPLLGERLAALNPEANPALAGPELALFLAEAANLGLGDEPVGTLAAWVDPDRNAAWFGALEAINEPDIVAALLEAAEIWATQHLPGVAALRGPASLDVRGLPGLLVDGFDRRPAAHLPYNAPYLPETVEAAGYTPASEEWQTYELPLSTDQPGEAGGSAGGRDDPAGRHRGLAGGAGAAGRHLSGRRRRFRGLARARPSPRPRPSWRKRPAGSSSPG